MTVTENGRNEGFRFEHCSRVHLDEWRKQPTYSIPQRLPVIKQQLVDGVGPDRKSWNQQDATEAASLP